MDHIENQFHQHSKDIHIVPRAASWTKLSAKLKPSTKINYLHKYRWFALAASLIGALMLTVISLADQKNAASSFQRNISSVPFDEEQYQQMIPQINELHEAYAKMNLSIRSGKR